ncbi:ornithine decarboxylase antizyme [Phlebotomus argentipes]|uniref:ornithine decarboxylase antizyme n=1 Tax=Phlebotomus argentipes TaxID=94469 RepID=UPI0028935F9B|nr:ornithine decarboxylase antizyme [Phlebotomus argentipes]
MKKKKKKKGRKEGMLEVERQNIWLRICTPDVPTSRTDHDKASFSTDCNRKTSLDSTSSSECSDIDYNETPTYDNDDYNDILKRILNKQHPVRISLKLYVTENTYSIWDTILDRSKSILYVALPSILLPAASKQSFISMLDFAEEKLKCNSVILCMQKDREDRANLVRTFLFLGFQPLAPKSDLVPPQAADGNNIFLIYNIDEE